MAYELINLLVVQLLLNDFIGLLLRIIDSLEGSLLLLLEKVDAVQNQVDLLLRLLENFLRHPFAHWVGWIIGLGSRRSRVIHSLYWALAVGSSWSAFNDSDCRCCLAWLSLIFCCCRCEVIWTTVVAHDWWVIYNQMCIASWVVYLSCF